MKRTRPDLAPAVPFLTTRVSGPNEDDWRKLRNVIEYLNQTKSLTLTLAADPTKPPKSAIDAAYSVHAGCKSYTGDSITLGEGTLQFHQQSNKHTLSESQAIDDPDITIKNEDNVNSSQYPSRKREKTEIMNIKGHDRYTKKYDLALIQMACMNQIADVAAGKRLSLNKGIRMWGGRGVDAVLSELNQIHHRDVFTPLNPRNLTPKVKKEALESHLFLEEKRNLDLKGRIVGGGNKQRSYTSKQEASSPTSHVESIFCIACMIAYQNRYSAVVDIPNAFVQTDLIKDSKEVTIIMRIRGRLADMLISIAPDVSKKHAIKDQQGNTLLYVKVLKALYGLMQASLMFYQKLLKDFLAKGFETNPYDPCVANKMINGK